MPRVIVVGSGIAGLFTALCAHRRGVRDIAIVAHAALEDWARALALDDSESHETANLALVGWAMTEAARRREESRGAHHRLDFPEPRAEWRRHQLFTLSHTRRGVPRISRGRPS